MKNAVCHLAIYFKGFVTHLDGFSREYTMFTFLLFKTFADVSSFRISPSVIKRPLENV